MSKRVLISLILVVVLLFSAVLPAWAGSIALADVGDTGYVVGLGRIHPLGGCEDPSGSSCDYG